MKAIKQFICLLVCFVLLSSSFMVGYAADDDLTVFSEVNFIEDSEQILGGYAVSTLSDIVASYSWLENPSFKLSDAIISSSEFILYDDLPYGKNTVVISVSYSYYVILFFLNGADSVVPTFIETWNTNGNCRIALESLSPIYRMAFTTGNGYIVSINGVAGLTKSNNTVVNVGGQDYYGYAYTLPAMDMYVSLTKNSSEIDKIMSLNGETAEAEYSIFSYPTRDDIDKAYREEQSETTKGIWETLKSLPSQIAESIKSFFTNLGDRISGFFDGLGDRISGFFTTLKNYLLYFQAEEPEGEGYSSVNFLSYLTDYITELSSNLHNFTESLDSSFNSIEGYITSGSNIINKLLGGVPILNAVLIFFLAFAVIRKAVGR